MPVHLEVGGCTATSNFLGAQLAFEGLPACVVVVGYRGVTDQWAECLGWLPFRVPLAHSRLCIWNN